MKITFEADRIRWQAENEKENLAVIALGDLVFFKPEVAESIVNDFGCTEDDLNYCCTPPGMTSREIATASVAMLN